MKRRVLSTAAAVITTVFVLAAPAQAAEITFELIYSGGGSNDAEAVGFVTFDDAVLPVPGTLSSEPAATVGVVDMEITVSGAASGNGTFTLEDFDSYSWNAGAALDLSTQLVGQPDFSQPFNHDWNVFAVAGSGAPSGVFWFSIGTNEGAGDGLTLISMRPVVSAADAKLARKGLKVDAKVSLAAYRSDHKGAIKQLKGTLATLPDAFDADDPGAFMGAVLQAVATAANTASLQYLIRSNEVDNAGSAALAPLGQGALPGLTVGDGGELDKFQASMDKELAKFNKQLAKAITRLLKKTRKKLPAGAVLTGRTFLLHSVKIADPGNDPGAVESGFERGTPLLLMGYGNVGRHHIIGVLSQAFQFDTPVLNVYDGDGVLLDNSIPFPAMAPSVRGLVLPVPVGAQLPHGNVRVESFSAETGWTSAIGY